MKLGTHLTRAEDAYSAHKALDSHAQCRLSTKRSEEFESAVHVQTRSLRLAAGHSPLPSRTCRHTEGYHQSNAFERVRSAEAGPSVVHQRTGSVNEARLRATDDDGSPHLPAQKPLEKFVPKISLFSADNVRRWHTPCTLNRFCSLMPCTFKLRRWTHTNLLEAPHPQAPALNLRIFSTNRHLHDEVTFREHTFPKAERYATKDWLHNLVTLTKSMVLHRIRSPVIIGTVWTFLIAIVQDLGQR